MSDLMQAIPCSGHTLMADVHATPRSTGLVVFVHGSGSSRLSPRNRHVAEVLQQRGLATVLFDLLTPAEGRDREAVFDIELLAQRLVGVLGWVAGHERIGGLPVGLFGASTGAAAALVASTHPDVRVRAIVSRGGRPDLAAASLPRVTAPTLLIVGGADDMVLDLNRRAAAMLRCPHALQVVPGATHLFEEPGTLDAVADLAAEWFLRHLQTAVGGGS